MLPSIDRLVALEPPRRARAPAGCWCSPRPASSPARSPRAPRAYSHFSQMRVATVFGGTSIGKNRQDLARGVDILVATPGRLIDLIEQRYARPSRGRDPRPRRGRPDARSRLHPRAEADRPAAAGEAPDPVLLGDHAEVDPASWPTSSSPIRPRSRSRRPSTTVERVEQYVSFCQQSEKQALLTMMLRAGFGERGKMDRVLIFTRTKHGADRVVKLLGQERHPGQRDPRQQEPAAARARSGRVQGRQGQDPGRDRHRRARHRRDRASATSSISSCPTSPSNMSTASAGRRAPAPPASPSPSARRTSAPISRASSG